MSFSVCSCHPNNDVQITSSHFRYIFNWEKSRVENQMFRGRAGMSNSAIFLKNYDMRVVVFYPRHSSLAILYTGTGMQH